VDGIPDPHLHAHCFVFNATFDETEQRWKAGQFADVKRDGPYFEALFDVKFAHRLTEMGIAVERTKKSWEIAGLEKSTLDKFSRRTAQIEELARELEAEAEKTWRKALIDDPQAKKKKINKHELGATSRKAKTKDLSFAELQKEWASRLTPEETKAVNQVTRHIGGQAIVHDPVHVREAVTLGVDHCFTRQSVVPTRQLLTESLKRAVGKGTAEAVEREFQSRSFITGERDGKMMATTAAVLAEEKRMIAFARQGRGTCPRLGTGDHTFTRTYLNDDQRRAVLHVLKSPDRCILIRGGAGVGKTTMLQEAVTGIEAGGRKVFAFAPSADASYEVLRGAGFKDATTVAMLLKDPNLQREAQGQVILIDEAGQLGAQNTAEIFDLVDRLDARLILCGDRRQHGSVERGAPLRLLETEAGLVPAEIKHILRQKDRYKHVVEALSEQRTADGFRQLVEMGWVREIQGDERYETLAKDYVEHLRRHRNDQAGLVVCPTHSEGDRLTQHIRDEMRRANQLKAKERVFDVLKPAHWTEAERADAVNYERGLDVLVFHQNARGFARGDRLVVGDRPLPVDQAKRFQVYRADKLAVSQGDLIRITRNGHSADGKHGLYNGSRYTIKGFTRSGDIVLHNGWKIAKDFGHFTHGHVVTSHASQGKSVKRVFIAQSADSFGASSREQFYVSVSRGKAQATIYTDDREALLEAVSHGDDRLTATEFIAERDGRGRGVAAPGMGRGRDLSPDPARMEQNREDRSYER